MSTCIEYNTALTCAGRFLDAWGPVAALLLLGTVACLYLHATSDLAGGAQ